MECKRCGTQEARHFYFDGTTYYCRHCIAFGRLNVGEEVEKKTYETVEQGGQFTLPFSLKPKQRQAIKEIIAYVDQQRNVLVYAACGAGKTEIAMSVLYEYSKQGYKVGFAISRRQVVLEIYERLCQAFQERTIAVVCEGYHECLDADIIVCTMHQLYRYYQSFDLLILDEVDAFPYKGNALLEKVAHDSAKGAILYLTATPSKEMLNQIQRKELAYVTLFERPHGFPLVVPSVKQGSSFIQVILLGYFLEKQRTKQKQVMVFVPSKKIANRLYLGLRLRYKVGCVYSSKAEKDEIIKRFKEKQTNVLITTTLMERGITIEDVQIIVLFGEHAVFDCASLIQIVGRVGRKASSPYGDAWILCSKKTEAVNACVETLKKMNEDLPISQVL